MAKVGQIVYNLQDYDQQEGYISTNKNNVNTTINTADKGYDPSNRFDIYSNIITGYHIAEISKLGIQAPPGTQFVVNGDKNMIVGRTGTYELDEDINITSLSFNRPNKYIYSPEATQGKLESGKTAMESAESNRRDSLNLLNGKDQYPDFSDFINVITNGEQDESYYVYPKTVYDTYCDEENYPKYYSLLVLAEEITDSSFKLPKDAVDTTVIDWEQDYWKEYLVIQQKYDEDYSKGYADLILGLRGVYTLSSEEGDLDNIIIDFLY